MYLFCELPYACSSPLFCVDWRYRCVFSDYFGPGTDSVFGPRARRRQCRRGRTFACVCFFFAALPFFCLFIFQRQRSRLLMIRAEFLDKTLSSYTGRARSEVARKHRGVEDVVCFLANRRTLTVRVSLAFGGGPEVWTELRNWNQFPS